eukprot:TRINITY_DN4361_c0_g1_i3.p1 TRINITY_DN4361_c0_g1~~TRINITY_DN4361_c0_g1_i3.p1  ORF type:complete len:344 (+),score=67.93 TRINITY_DN4361_c0_g1_i3:55-1086(+)
MSRRAAAAAGKEDASNAADVKDLWGLIMEAGAKELESRREINVLFLGARNSGKTTLINRFLKKAGTKDEAVKPTTALDYRFARRTGNDASKEVAHIWELGGGLKMSKLVETVITPRTVASTVILLAVDLSKPSLAFETVSSWIEIVRARILVCLKELESQNSPIPAMIRERAKEVAGPVYTERIPMAIIATKYDRFIEEKLDTKKFLSRALRFLAFMHGCSLIYTSNKDEVLTNNFGTLMNQFCFAFPSKLIYQDDPSKPITIPSGSDGAEKIGLPDDAGKAGSFQNPMDAWKAGFRHHFPLAKMKPSSGKDEEDDNGDFDEQGAAEGEGTCQLASNTSFREG